MTVGLILSQQVEVLVDTSLGNAQVTGYHSYVRGGVSIKPSARGVDHGGESRTQERDVEEVRFDVSALMCVVVIVYPFAVPIVAIFIVL